MQFQIIVVGRVNFLLKRKNFKHTSNYYFYYIYLYFSFCAFNTLHCQLIDYEIEHKEKNLINSMIKIDGFPFIKDINDFDFSYQDNIDK